MLNYNMYSKYYDSLNINNPLEEYPRPTFVRKSYKSLNGVWKYEITKKDETPGSFLSDICVPFVVESSLSLVRKDLNNDEALWYKRSFCLDESFNKDHVIIHFDGIFQTSEIYINGVKLGTHEGGFLPFSIDIKDFLQIENTLLIKVLNKPDYNLGVGKEGKSRGGMWYTKTTGIYKSVWVEAYDDEAIIDFDIETKIDGSVSIRPISNNNSFKVNVSFKGTEILNDSFEESINFKIENPKLWSPEEPNLYDITICSGSDQITSYFAFRLFEAKDNKFYLNGNPYFVNGLLYQPYFSDGIYSPATYEAFKEDILRMKELGFNTLRVHIKVEAMMFYYFADKYGILIFQDFPNSGKYNFFVDTILPTIGYQGVCKNYVSKKRLSNFVTDNNNLMMLLKKNPSVVYYTIFNEGWGQFKADSMYDYFKSLYPSYVFDSTSGWFKKKKSDVLSLHIYFRKLKIKKSNKPVIISEFGGYNYRDSSHAFNSSNDYGYHKCLSIENLTNDIVKLYKDEVIPLIKEGLAGVIYTQVNDVEDETNGLITYDRKMTKVNTKRIREIMEIVKYE